MKRLSMVVVVVSGLLFATAYAADEKVKLDGIKCPVAGSKDAKEASSVAYKDGKVYFCCNNCPKAFDKDKAKFATKANHQLVATGQAKQAKCPISGADLDKDKNLTIAGAKVGFCCDNCKGKVEKESDADKKLELVFSDKAFDKAGFKVEKKK
jgi:YHS domain-containing protein